MNPQVQGYAAAILDSTEGDERAALAADLASVDRLFDRNAELRAALTDSAVPGPARRAVLSELLEGRVSPGAQRLAAYAAGAVRGQEVPGAVAWVANRARQTVEHGASDEELLGHRQARERVGGYAAAVFEDVGTADLEEVEDELFRFARIVDATPALRAALTDRDLPSGVRRSVVDALLSGKVQPATVRLADYTVVGGRPRDVVGTLDWLVEETARARGWRVARVRAGQDVDPSERAKLESTLSRLTGSPVELQVTVDPLLLAGVRVEIGDLRLDETARGRLERLREHVVAGGWQDLGFGPARRSASGPAAAAATATEPAAPDDRAEN